MTIGSPLLLQDPPQLVSLEGFRIALCQPRCKPADPLFNAGQFIAGMREADAAGADLVVGPEGLNSYLIGDQLELHSYLRLVDAANRRIVEASNGLRAATAYGTLLTEWGKTGEDGRVRRKNGGLIIQSGGIQHRSNKTLGPNYRMFPEARYFFDNRKIAEAIALETGRPLKEVLIELLRMATVRRRDGQTYRIGQILCEDGWQDDYEVHPLVLMAEHIEDGEEWVAIDHSASPWTWRKNQKRHSVIRKLILSIPKERRPTCTVYGNRVGVEQAAKNFYYYDGSSCIYNKDGELVHEVEPHKVGTKLFTFGSNTQPVASKVPDDTQAMYEALGAVTDQFYGSVPDTHRFVYVGLSGGIDSAAKAALLVSRPSLGPKRVIGVNMPYGRYNSREGKSDARAIAKNLGIKYLVVNITSMVDEIAKKTGVAVGTLAHQNIQARVRMEVLAGLAQKKGTVNGLKKRGGLFTANGNKVEMTFGYGTLYADIAGATMLLGDLVKREVYQLSDYMNRVIYDRMVIPQSVFTRVPTAELAKAQADPFDYGNLTQRGYHDEWVRAVTEFRWDPERFLAEYQAGTLEKAFMLPEGRLKVLFPTKKAFIKRLERDWRSFCTAYFKRMQCPPVPVITRRAYGGDLAESLYAAPLLEAPAYLAIKGKILGTTHSVPIAA